MSAKRIKARKMWAHISSKNEILNVSTRMLLNEAYFAPGTIAKPVYIIPADAASYDAMVKQMTRAIACLPFYGAKEKWWNAFKRDYCNRWCEARDNARAALQAIGIVRPLTRPAKTRK